MINNKIKIILIFLLYFSIYLFFQNYYNNNYQYQQKDQFKYNKLINNNDDDKILNKKIENLINNINNLIKIGNSKYVYEESRSEAREYIRDYLIDNGISKDNIVWNHFEWNERYAEGKNITTTTWTGINIVVWSNSSEVDIDKQPIRIIGANYDTKNWGENRTSGAHDNLSGTTLLMELIIEFNQFIKENNSSGKSELPPFMFIFFDQEKPGSLGSRSWVNKNIKNSKNSKQYQYFINIDSIGYQGTRSIIQTFPYEHQKKTLFSPRWLVNEFIQSAYIINPIDGIHLGSSNLGKSIMYQAHRYHLPSVSYLGDEGPFIWAGVDSLLLTDLDYFYDHKNNKIPTHNQLSDQSINLDQSLLKEYFKIIFSFLINSSQPSHLSKSSLNNNEFIKLNLNINPILNLLFKFINNLLNLIFSANYQYLFIGPIQLSYFQLLLINLFLLNLIYLTTFREYRNLVYQFEKLKYQQRKRIYRLKKQNDQQNQFESNSEKEDGNNNNNNNILNGSISLKSSSTSTSSFLDSGHRILFIHLLLLSIVSFGDTVYSFEIICLGFLGLSTFTITKYNLNLFTGFISSAFCSNFIYKDLNQIYTFGRKNSNSSHQLYLNMVLGIYIAHSILLLIYGYDFGKKKIELLNHKDLKIEKEN